MDRQRQSTWNSLLAGIVLTLGMATIAVAQSESVPKSPAVEGSRANWRVLANTALLAAGVVLWAVPAGTLLAILLFRTDVPGRRGAIAAIVLLLFLPLYVQVGGWEAAIGKLGWLTSVTKRPLLIGMRAVIFLHARAAIPWVVLIVSAGLRLVRREEEEIALWMLAGQVIARSCSRKSFRSSWLRIASWPSASASEMTVTNIYLSIGEYTLAEQVYMTLQSEPLATAVVQSLPSIGATALGRGGMVGSDIAG
jgi:ABC-type sulfate transport system permease component